MSDDQTTPTTEGLATYPESSKKKLQKEYPDAEIATTFLHDDHNGFKWRSAFLVLPDGHLPGDPIVGIWWDEDYVPKELRK